MKTAARPGRPDVEPALSENAIAVLKRRYLAPGETAADLFWRVAWHVAQAETAYGGDAAAVAARFYRAMAACEFMPNSPALMNAGRELGQLFACFVLPVSDALQSPGDDGIFDSIRSAALIHQSGGGTGFSFSRLRPEGARVASSGGRASGPVSFMRVFNSATDAIHQGGFRRGANMGILRVDHPDILDFVNLKADPREMANFNLSVALTDDFLRAVREDRPHETLDPHTGRREPLRDKVRDAAGHLSGYGERVWSARELYDLIVQRAWESGEPGIVFLDRINAFNPTPQLGAMEATNPCVTGDTRVWTEDAGWVPIRDLVDRRARIATAEHGRFSFRDTSRVVCTGVKPVYRLRTSEGYELVLTGDHLVATENGDVPAAQLEPGSRIVLANPASPPVEQDSRDARLGELVGWLVGDGHFTLHTEGKPTAVLSFYGRDKLEAAPRLLRTAQDLIGDSTLTLGEVTDRDLAYVRSQRLRECLADRGVGPACKQRVPELVWRANDSLVAGYCRGLFSADGSVQGAPAHGVSVRLASNQAELLRDVQMLLLRLGIQATVHENRRTEGVRLLPDGRGALREYTCSANHELIISKSALHSFAAVVGFLIRAKTDRLETALAEYSRGPYRSAWLATVQDVSFEGEAEVYDLSEPETNHFFANGLLVHNCGEQPLLPFEACNLASVNLGHFVDDGPSASPESRIQWSRLAETVKLVVRYLDDTIDANRYPKPQVEAIVKGNRKIGLGLMGWADMLFRLEIPYDSDDAVALARTLMKFIRDEGWAASMDLATERGPFPNHAESAWAKGHPYFRAPRPVRNATVTTVAPTGTISIIAGASGGVEPVFSIAYERHVMDGTRLVEVHPHFRAVGEREGWFGERLARAIMASGSVRGRKDVPERWQNVFASARDVSPEGHLRMQAAFQDFTDNAVSKTVNFPREATPETIRRVYDLAVELGVKGVTVYRDGSRTGQPMQLAARDARDLAERATGVRYRYPTNLGTAHVMITDDERGPRELFMTIGKAGSDINALTQAMGRLVSTALGYGVPAAEIARQLLNITSEPVPHDGGWVKSVPDAIGQALARYLAERDRGGPAEEVGSPTGGLCPDCGAPLVVESGCRGGKCLSCGFSKC